MWWYLAKSYELKKNTYFQRNISHELLNAFIPYQFFKILLKSSHNIESALYSSNFLSHKSAIFNPFDLARFGLSVPKECEQLSGHASKQESHGTVQTQR